MQHHDPHMQNLEGTLTHDATPRCDEDEDEQRAREQPSDRFAAGMRDLPAAPSGARRYYEF